MMDAGFAFDSSFHGWLLGAGDDIPQLAQGFFSFSRQLMFSCLLIGGFLLVRKRLPWVWVAGSLLVCILFLADNLSLAPLVTVLGGVSARLETVNSDLALMMLLAVLAVLLTGLSIWRRTRSQDRIIWAVVAAVMVVTGTWFHLLLINGQMISLMIAEEELMKSVALLPEDRDFAQSCAVLQLECTTNPITERYTHALPLLEETVYQYRQHPPPGRAPGAPGAFTFRNPDNTTGGPYVVAYTDNGTVYRLLVSRYRLRLPYNATASAFMLQMGIAHAVWLFGAIAVMAGHRWRGYRLRRMQTIKSRTPSTSQFAAKRR